MYFLGNDSSGIFEQEPREKLAILLNRTSDIGHRTSDIGHRTSDVEY